MESKSVCSNDIESKDQEKNAEEEMEKFYERMREMKSQLHQLQEKNKRKRAASDPGGWAPAFQSEDFTTEIEFKKHFPTMINNNNRKQGGKSRVGSTSDLNLQLNL